MAGIETTDDPRRAGAGQSAVFFAWPRRPYATARPRESARLPQQRTRCPDHLQGTAKGFLWRKRPDKNSARKAAGIPQRQGCGMPAFFAAASDARPRHATGLTSAGDDDAAGDVLPRRNGHAIFGGLRWEGADNGIPPKGAKCGCLFSPKTAPASPCRRKAGGHCGLPIFWRQNAQTEKLKIVQWNGYSQKQMVKGIKFYWLSATGRNGMIRLSEKGRQSADSLPG